MNEKTTKIKNDKKQVRFITDSIDYQATPDLSTVWFSYPSGSSPRSQIKKHFIEILCAEPDKLVHFVPLQTPPKRKLLGGKDNRNKRSKMVSRIGQKEKRESESRHSLFPKGT